MKTEEALGVFSQSVSPSLDNSTDKFEPGRLQRLGFGFTINIHSSPTHPVSQHSNYLEERGTCIMHAIIQCNYHMEDR